MNVLVLNCGSSSLKFAVIDPDARVEHVSGLAQRLGSPEASLDVKRNGTKTSKPIAGALHDEALRDVVDALRELGLADGLLAVGHRVVHGGHSKFSGSMAITPEVIAKVEECIPLGPLHNPPNLLGIRIAQNLFPGLRQVAVFDTAFHADDAAPYASTSMRSTPGSRERHAIRKYGFHGTSHRYVAREAVRLLGLPADDQRDRTATSATAAPARR